MEVRNGKKMNFKRIYSQIAKYGKTIPELAEEYGMDETAFVERIRMGLDSKLFLSALSANERHIKERKMCKKNFSLSVEKEEKKELTEKQKTEKSVLDELEGKKRAIIEKVSNEETTIKEAIEILKLSGSNIVVYEKEVKKRQDELNETINKLHETKNKRAKAEEEVRQHTEIIERMKEELKSVETQISELKNKDIFLVAPNFIGKKPEFGTFYSTTVLNGFENISVIEVTDGYELKPNLDDMIEAGYDSYKEYMEGLKFVMLYIDFLCENKKYTTLISDERLKKLLELNT